VAAKPWQHTLLPEYTRTIMPQPAELLASIQSEMPDGLRTSELKDSDLHNPSLTRRATSIVIWVFIALGLPALFLGTWLTYRGASDTAELALANRIPLVAQLVEHDMSGKLQGLENAAKLLQVNQVTEISQQQLDSIVSGFSGVSWAGVANLQGEVVRAHQNLLLGANVSKRPWFVEGLRKATVLDKHDAVLLAKLLPAREKPYQFIDMSVPVVSPSGGVIGVLALHLDWMWFQSQFPQLVDDFNQAGTVDLVVYGRDNEPRLTHFAGGIPKPWNANLTMDHLKTLLESDFFMVQYSGPKGSILDSLGWTLLALESKQSIYQRVQLASFFGLAMLFLGLLATGGLFVRLSRSVSAIAKSFVEALASRNEEMINTVQQRMPRELLPLAAKAQHRFEALRNEQDELHRALMKAQASHLQIHQLIAQAPVAMAMFDENMNYLACSNIWQSTYLPHESHPCGKSHYDLLPNMSENWRAAHNKGLNGEVVSETNDPFLNAQGETEWINWVVQPWYQQNNSVGGIIIMTENVSMANRTRMQLEISEERLKLAMRGSHDGLWDWDLHTNAVYYSPSWKTMLGYAPDELANETETWDALLHPEDRDNANHIVSSAIANPKQTQFTCSFRLRHRNQSWVHILSRGLILREADGTAKRMVGTHLDRTEVDKLQAELQEAWLVAQAEAHSNDAKSRFLATVSHEIRNPLNSISGFARLIHEETSQQPHVQRYTKLLSQTTDGLTLVLNDLLDFAKIDAGKMELVEAPFNLKSLVDDLASGAKLLCNGKGIELKVDLNLESPESYYLGDAMRMRQIIQNLLSNAIKFTHKGVLRLKATYQIESQRVVLEVSDTGIGIAQDRLEKLFKPFTQAHTDGASLYGGTGLGLTIVKSLAELMKGEVFCSSTFGVGSQFTVTIPLTCCSSPVVIVANEIEFSPPKRVLIADDAPANLKILEAFLSKRGHHIDTAHSGDEALRKIQTHGYDHILLDMDMPGLSGLQVLKAVRLDAKNINQHTQFACISGHAYSSDSEEALGGGFARYFTKPINWDELLRYVQAA
jgi:PAS domain S-box-containing protein